MDTITEIIYRIEEAQKAKEYMLLLMMDVKAAFPHIVRNKLVEKMKKSGIPDYLTRWTLSFMTERRVILTMGGEDNLDKMKINTRILQESPILLILLLIYIVDLFPRLEGKFNCKSLSFVDDVTVLVKDKNPRKGAKIAKNIMKDMIEQKRENKVAFDIDKTKFFYLIRKRKSNIENITIKIEGVEFKPNKKAIRILGVWIDSRLIFKEYSNTISLKGLKVLNRLQDLTKTQELQIGNCKRVMIACVQSILLYRAEIWQDKQKNRKKNV